MYTRVKYSAEVSEEPDGEPIVKEWREPQAERLYGVEKYERTLLCVKAFHLQRLGDPPAAAPASEPVPPHRSRRPRRRHRRSNAST